MTQTVTLDEALDFVERLPRENWSTLVDIIRKREIELRRDEIIQNANEARAAYARCELKAMTVAEFMKELDE